MKTKQVKLSNLPNFINNLVKQGYIIQKTVKNGNYSKGKTFEPYIKVHYYDFNSLLNEA